jgi:hypothetical protein
MDPEVNGNTPVIKLNTVVLPAPLGPIRPKISEAFILMVKFLMASTPPKCFVTLLIVRIEFPTIDINPSSH